MLRYYGQCRMLTINSGELSPSTGCPGSVSEEKIPKQKSPWMPSTQTSYTLELNLLALSLLITLNHRGHTHSCCQPYCQSYYCHSDSSYSYSLPTPTTPTALTSSPTTPANPTPTTSYPTCSTQSTLSTYSTYIASLLILLILLILLFCLLCFWLCCYSYYDCYYD